MEKNARIVIAAIVKAAEKNQKLPDRATPGTAPPFRRSGDALTEYYVREAAAVARDLPQGKPGPRVPPGTGDLSRYGGHIPNESGHGPLWRRIEPDEQREARLKVIGLPTIFARHDSCQHFVDSAALVAVRGELAAEAAGIVKELLDSRPGGSGFSFADLASDMSGVAFGREVLAEPGLLLVLAEKFAVADYAVPPDGLVEGLNYGEFASRYGSVADPHLVEGATNSRKRVKELPAYRPAPPEAAEPAKAADPADKVVPDEKKEKHKLPENKLPDDTQVEKSPPTQPARAARILSGRATGARSRTTRRCRTEGASFRVRHGRARSRGGTPALFTRSGRVGPLRVRDNQKYSTTLNQ